jgi:hypothetical protein
MKAIFFLFVLLALECGASEPALRLTGEKLLQDLHDPLDDADRETLKRAFAQGYLAGVSDATQDKVWCITWIKSRPCKIHPTP